MIGILVTLVLALVVLIAVAVSRRDNNSGGGGGGHHHPHHYPHYYHKKHIVTPWCSHLRFGCCPESSTPKVDREGSNCRLY